MCVEEVTTILKVSGLFILLQGVLFAFLFFSFFHNYELHLRILSSGFVSLFFNTLIWIAVLLAIRIEENHEIKEDEEDIQELLQV
jgi:hypothetical protein